MIPDLPSSAADLLQYLRQKKGNWVSWGRACQQLQKLGYTPQVIFEQTGFEPIQQNQIIVAAQVYATLEHGNASSDVLTHFAQRGSDSLYELRVLNQPERVAAASWLVHKAGNSEVARELAKAMQQFKQLRHPPSEFGDHPGDALAWECWRLARQQEDPTLRTRYIAKGLRFAFSDSARAQLEALLMEATSTPAVQPPRLPWYRLESEQECPRVVPVAGHLPLDPAVWQGIPLFSPSGSFHLIHFAGEGAWVALPGWVVLQTATDPLAVLTTTDYLPHNHDTTAAEEVLLVIDRGSRTWQPDRYLFAEDGTGHLTIQWFAQPPNTKIWGTLLVIVRPPRILDPEPQAWHLED